MVSMASLSSSSFSSIAYHIPVSLSHNPNGLLNCGGFKIANVGDSNNVRKFKMHKCLSNSASAPKDANNASIDTDVPFPSDYSQLILQATEATEAALKDKIQLMEIEFPTAGLESVPGDGEGGIEMTGSMQLIREYCDCFVKPENAARTRIFFPEANEVDFARVSTFGGASYKLDYLTKPSFFEDFGFGTKIKMSDRVKPEDEMYIVGYPYFNVNEMLVVEELYKEAVQNTSRNMIIFNGELDRIRYGYYPSFFYPKLAALTKTLFPKMESVYYIHNFKGRYGGVLFRCYPGPWKVLRKGKSTYKCIHQQVLMVRSQQQFYAFNSHLNIKSDSSVIRGADVLAPMSDRGTEMFVLDRKGTSC